MICDQCGTENPANAVFCGKCGRNIAQESAQQPAQPAQQAQQAVAYEKPRTFVRCSNDKQIGGVCSGFAKYFDLDVSLVRILTVVSFLFTGSATFWAYIIMWAIIPEEPCGPIQ
ncbi:MAG: PspC domain-containing protein [Candidatus Heimdallarchaeota archaeon]|nr:PspC domain-containing protein [Candidatus Heimdallarchaeota archaeon]